MGIRVSVWLGVRVSAEPTPNPLHSLCLSMFQLIGWSVLRFQRSFLFCNKTIALMIKRHLSVVKKVQDCSH